MVKAPTGSDPSEGKRISSRGVPEARLHHRGGVSATARRHRLNRGLDGSYSSAFSETAGVPSAWSTGSEQTRVSPSTSSPQMRAARIKTPGLTTRSKTTPIGRKVQRRDRLTVHRSMTQERPSRQSLARSKSSATSPTRSPSPPTIRTERNTSGKLVQISSL